MLFDCNSFLNTCVPAQVKNVNNIPKPQTCKHPVHDKKAKLCDKQLANKRHFVITLLSRVLISFSFDKNVFRIF